ncbi:MAG: ferritin-like domain-containing protein [Nitrospinota bacterium]
MKGNEEVVKSLNTVLSMELAAILQYLHHHWTGEGMESQTILPLFKKISMDEMKHAGLIAERINFLEGDPTITPSTIRKYGDLIKMMQDDLAGEYEAIGYYKKVIRLCAEVGDSTSRLMMEEILSDEEGHADIWETTLSEHKR